MEKKPIGELFGKVIYKSSNSNEEFKKKREKYHQRKKKKEIQFQFEVRLDNLIFFPEIKYEAIRLNDSFINSDKGYRKCSQEEINMSLGYISYMLSKGTFNTFHSLFEESYSVNNDEGMSPKEIKHNPYSNDFREYLEKKHNGYGLTVGMLSYVDFVTEIYRLRLC